jgi:hypothetical protein
MLTFSANLVFHKKKIERTNLVKTYSATDTIRLFGGQKPSVIKIPIYNKSDVLVPVPVAGGHYVRDNQPAHWRIAKRKVE